MLKVVKADFNQELLQWKRGVGRPQYGTGLNSECNEEKGFIAKERGWRYGGWKLLRGS